MNKSNRLLSTVLASTIALTGSVMANDAGIALQGMKQIGLEIGAFSNSSEADKDSIHSGIDASSTSPSVFLRYQHWFSDQAALILQAGVLRGEVDFEFVPKSDRWKMKSETYSVVPLLIGIQLKPCSFETSSRSFFAVDLAVGPYIVSGTEVNNLSTRSKSETVFGGYAGIGHHWFLGSKLLLSLNARYHLTTDFEHKLSGMKNANGFNGTIGVSWVW